MKILLDYNPDTGAIINDAGLTLFIYHGLEEHEHKAQPPEQKNSQQPLASADIVALKNAGFDTSDIAYLHALGITR